MPKAQTNDVDLSNCDREPIHFTGRVQSYGFLIAVASDWVIAHASDNLSQFAGRAWDDVIGEHAGTLFTAEAIHTIRNRLQWLQTSDTTERIFGLDVFGDGRPHDVAVHLSDALIVIEIEPSDTADQMDAIGIVRSMMNRLAKAEGSDQFFAQAARQVRFVTGHDRVMIYRFLDDGSGEVIAESCEQGMEPYLGLRYPASDIPKQARALYTRNLLRLIADVDGPVSRIEPQTRPDGQPVDLSLSVLRAVSPIHLEYLRNMGVAASMSISIVVDGELWGLIACHGREPKFVNFHRRSAAELFGQMFALELANRERAELYRDELKSRQVHDRVMATISVDGSVFQNLSNYLESFRETVNCDGVGIWIDGAFASIGRGASEDEMRELARFLNRSSASRVFATNELSAQHPPAAEYADRVSGILAVPVSRKPRDYLVFFRGEVAQAVTWAGNPDKPVEVGPNGARLTPRQSFEAWRQVVRGKSTPWSQSELNIAESLRVTLMEVILRSVDEGQKLRKQAQEKQDLLIGELNHRVRNILTLVRGIVSQTRETAGSVDAFALVVGGRIHALARAHDQLTAENWAPSAFRLLIRNEAEAYLGESRDRLSLTGPNVYLDPQAFSTLALVIHELITNSAKYGALSEREGAIDVRWDLDAHGALAIDWKERDGPPVSEPTRRGFGTTIIERSIPFELKGTADLRFEPTGLKARFTIPGAFVDVRDDRPDTDDRRETAADAGVDAVAPDTTVLLVEDNVIIALDAEHMLRQIGVADIVVAGGVTSALTALDRQRIDFAVLDINLGDETSVPVAEELLDRGIPFAFASGYGDPNLLSETLRDAPLITKPYTETNLRAILARTAATKEG